jgi:hypothetical protein
MSWTGWKRKTDTHHCSRVQVNPQNRMDLWAIEHQVRANRLSTASLARASRALVWVTVGLVIVTLGQLLLAILDHKW